VFRANCQLARMMAVQLETYNSQNLLLKIDYPATSNIYGQNGLGSCRSTTELRPHFRYLAFSSLFLVSPDSPLTSASQTAVEAPGVRAGFLLRLRKMSALGQCEAHGDRDGCSRADDNPAGIALDSKVLGIELAADTRRSFNSTNREPIVRQQRRRRFYPCIFFSRI
jgi:hypothetical protein